MTTLKSIVEAQKLEIAAKSYMVANEQMMFNTLKRVQGRSAKVANWLRLLDNMAEGV